MSCLVCLFHSVSVVIALGKRPVTFRTRKLSLSAPMVLQGGPCGRVGRRRTPFRKSPVPLWHGAFSCSGGCPAPLCTRRPQAVLHYPWIRVCFSSLPQGSKAPIAQ